VTERREGSPKYRANSIVGSWHALLRHREIYVSWEHEFALPFINEGHFYVTAPGRLRAPIKDFSLRRDEGLELIIETRCPPDAKSTEPERPPGTVRLNVESAELENIGGMKAKLQGVIPYRFWTTDNYRTGESELTEEAQIHEISAVVQADGEARYTIDWLENLPARPFHWPGSIDTKTEIMTTRKIGTDDDDVITLFSKEIEQSGANHAVKIVVDGVGILPMRSRTEGRQPIEKTRLHRLRRHPGRSISKKSKDGGLLRTERLSRGAGEHPLRQGLEPYVAEGSQRLQHRREGSRPSDSAAGPARRALAA
jgi:hypothetical protein